MRGSSDSNGNAVECTECDPPRRFKNRAGLNGHTQFKHGHLPDNRAVMPNGKQSQMYEDLTALVEQGFDEVRYRLDSLVNVNGNGQGNGNSNGQGNGNGNGQGNGNGISDEPIGVVSPPRDESEEPTYRCEGCNAGGLTPGEPECAGCGERLDWNGVGQKKKTLDLPLQMPRL